ncbi:MAG TPA: hypothetical protein VGK30_09345 [Candidatus Binatia bacterium]
MRVGRSVAVAAALLAMLSFGATAHAQNKCSSGKAKLAGKKAAAILGCLSKASKKGGDVNAQAPGCIAKAQSKFTAGSQKIDSKQDVGKPETVCPAGSGDEVARENDVDNFTTDVSNDLDPGSPSAFTLSKCTSGKIKCAGKKAAAKLGCFSKALGKNLPVDPLCISKAETKFAACYSKLESKEAPAKPDNSNVCVQPDGDAGAIETKVDNFVNAIVAAYSTPVGPTPTATATPGPATCPSEIQFTGTSTNGVLDTGWTGNGHDATTITNGTVTVSVTGCSGSAPNCHVCSYTGPLENHAGQIHVQRCQGDSSITCTSNAACGANGPCVFFFGSNLPLAAGGVSTCVQNVFAGGISGTANVDTSGAGAGTSVGSASLTSIVFNGITLSNPCPQCNGDGATNDGIKGGTCSGGAHNGATCDVNGASPNISFGKTSLDCPPLVGAKIAALPINLNNTTGTKTRTLVATSPTCRAPGWGGNKCQCDTCGDNSGTVCATDADCGAGVICGGKRCIGGANIGAACTAASQCPGSACSATGAQTAANQCDGGPGSGDCVADPGTPGPNDRICSSGPLESFCGPVETFRGCAANSDCTFAGDTCTVTRFRDCFDNGVLGETVSSSGQADPPSGHQSDPTLAALFCVGPTSSASVNSAAGLPGLGRLELQGHSVDNGTP